MLGDFDAGEQLLVIQALQRRLIFEPCALDDHFSEARLEHAGEQILGGKRREIGALFLQHVQKHAVSILAEKVERELLILPAGCRRARESERLGSAEPEVCELHLAEAVLHGLSVFAEPDMRVGAHALEGFDIGRVRFDLREARKKLCAAVTELREKMIA